MKKILNNYNLSGPDLLLRVSIFLIIGVTPLFFNFFYPTNIDLAKVVLFRISTSLLLLATVWRFIDSKIFFSKKNLRNFLPLALLLLYLAFSLFFSVDASSSWSGIYSRYEGLESWLFFAVFSLLILLNIRSKKDIVNLLKLASLSSLLVSLYAIAQYFGFDVINWQEPAYLTKRAFSTLGQPNYLSCWLVLVIPFTAYLYFSVRGKAKYLWLFVVLIQLLALLFTGSRAVFFTFLPISFLFFILNLFIKKELSKKKLIIWTLVFISAFSLFLSNLFFSDKGRFSELFDFKQGSIFARVELWGSAFEAIKDKPFFGYGLENQQEVYFKYYQKDWAVYSPPNTYSDRAHNLILDILLTSGIFGLLFFSYFIFSIFQLLIRSYKENKDDLIIFLSLSLSTYLVSLLFNFSVIATNIYFWLIIALVFYLSQPVDFIKRENKLEFLQKIALLGAALSIVFYCFLVESRKITADYYYLKSLEAIRQGKYFTALTLKSYMDATYPNKIISNYYNKEIAIRLAEMTPEMDKVSYFFIKPQLILISEDLLGNRSENLFAKYLLDSVINPYTQESKYNWESLVASSPEMPKLYLVWADILFKSGLHDEAEIKLNQALENLPDINNKYLNQAHKNDIIYYNELINYRLKNIKQIK